MIGFLARQFRKLFPPEPEPPARVLIDFPCAACGKVGPAHVYRPPAKTHVRCAWCYRGNVLTPRPAGNPAS